MACPGIFLLPAIFKACWTKWFTQQIHAIKYSKEGLKLHSTVNNLIPSLLHHTMHSLFANMEEHAKYIVLNQALVKKEKEYILLC